jgi:hypothetical protein
VSDIVPARRHRIHYGHHHMGKGGTSAAGKEKTGHHAWVCHLPDATAGHSPVTLDRRTSEQWRGETVPQPGHAVSCSLMQPQHQQKQGHRISGF